MSSLNHSLGALLLVENPEGILQRGSNQGQVPFPVVRGDVTRLQETRRAWKGDLIKPVTNNPPFMVPGQGQDGTGKACGASGASAESRACPPLPCALGPMLHVSGPQLVLCEVGVSALRGWFWGTR